MTIKDSVMNVPIKSLSLSVLDRSIKVKYKNWKGETSIRIIIPEQIHYGHTAYHPQDQWLLDVWDIEKDAQRTYSMMNIIEFIKEEEY